MKKLLLLGVAAMALVAGTALAGDYHSGTTLNCAECHVMHYSQTHGYNADGTGITVGLGADGPYHFLLRDHVNELCLSCHDNQTFAPDVLAENGGNVTANGRQAGALNRDDVAPYFDATGHTLGSTDVAPGGTFVNANGLSCIDCHTQHGRSTGGQSIYRNANVFITGTPAVPFMTYAIGTNDVTKDIYEVSATFGGNHYDMQNVAFNEPVATGSGYGTYCKQCHTDFHGSSSDANMRVTTAPTQEEWLRHPTADANIGAVGHGHASLSKFTGQAYRVQVMSATGNWGTWGATWTGAPTDLTPSCMSCHKAHGNQRAFGLIWATGEALPGEDGDGTNYKILCGQCHTQAP